MAGIQHSAITGADLHGIAIGGDVESGTSGSVLFVDGSGNLAQDNANFFYDATGNQLKLTAGSAADVPFLVKLASGQTANAFEIQPHGSTTPLVKFDSKGNLTIDRPGYDLDFNLRDLNGDVLRVRSATLTAQLAANFSLTFSADAGLARKAAGVVRATDGNAGNDGHLALKTETPASASSTGVAGTITWDTNYIYICTATNTWKRSALSTW